LAKYSLPALKQTNTCPFTVDIGAVFQLPVDNSYADFVITSAGDYSGVNYQNFDFTTWEKGASVHDGVGAGYSYAQSQTDDCFYVTTRLVDVYYLTQIYLTTSLNTAQEIIGEEKVQATTDFNIFPLAANSEVAIVSNGTAVFVYYVECKNN